MTYDKIFHIRTIQTYQRGDKALSSIFIQRSSCRRINEALQRFKTTGLPIRPRSIGCRTRIASTRGEDCLYRQIAGKSSSAYQKACFIDRTLIKRYNDSGFGGFSQQRSGAWLRNVTPKGYTWNIAMIVWHIEKFLKSIKCWYQRRTFALIH